MADLNIGDVKVAISHFLDVVVNARGGEQERLEALERALDMLAWMQQVAGVGAANASDRANGPEGSPTGPDPEYDKMRQIVAQQFPTFGEVQVPAFRSKQNGKPGPETRNAGDDLAGIAHEVFQVAQRFQNKSDADALDAFVSGYRQRWRTKLRSLQWYLEFQR